MARAEELWDAWVSCLLPFQSFAGILHMVSREVVSAQLQLGFTLRL